MRSLILLLLISITTTSFAQKEKIKGVVSYYFNEYQGDKPDLGATVYAVDSSKCLNFNNEIAFSYELASIKMDYSEDTSFAGIDKKNALNNIEIIHSEFVNSTTVDATGNYSLELPPGVYYVLIKSKGRNGLTMTDLMGCVYYIKIHLTHDQPMEISHNFPLN